MTRFLIGMVIGLVISLVGITVIIVSSFLKE